jgi:hypothetical protein
MALLSCPAQGFSWPLSLLVFFRYKVKSATFDENLPVGLQVNILDIYKDTILYMCVFLSVCFCQCVCLHGLPCSTESENGASRLIGHKTRYR